MRAACDPLSVGMFWIVTGRVAERVTPPAAYDEVIVSGWFAVTAEVVRTPAAMVANPEFSVHEAACVTTATLPSVKAAVAV